MTYVLFILFVASTHLLADPLPDAEIENYISRIKQIEQFKKSTYPAIELRAKQDLEAVKNYQNEKLLIPEKLQISHYQTAIEAELGAMSSHIASIDANYAQSKLTELLKLKEKKQQYLDAELRKKEMERLNSGSKNLKKYFELVQSSNAIDDAKSQARYFLLSKEEKGIADSFKENYFYLLREAGIQDALARDIKVMKREVEDRLKYPEEAMASVVQSKNKVDQVMLDFRQIGTSLDGVVQFGPDLKVEKGNGWNWAYGLFNCDEAKGPTYQRLKHFPDLLLLGNGDTRAVIKLDKNNPSKAEKVYSCKKSGKITGGCLDNTEKELCQLDQECKGYLEKAEMEFNLAKSFQQFQSTIKSTIVNRQASDHFNGKGTLSIIMDYKKKGDYSLTELKLKFQAMTSLIDDVSSSDPNDYYAKVDKVLTDYLIKEKQKSSTSLGNNTLMIEYMVNSLKSEFEAIKKNDFVQEVIYQQCPVSVQEIQAFCSHYSEFKKRAALFKDREDITNLTPKDCPKMTFRFPKDSFSADPQCPDPLPGENLEDLMKVNKKLKDQSP
jgi:hypothetical protein